jgi:lipoate---protein ligase
MLLIDNISNDPYLNLAAEEYFLKESSEDILMFYINSPSLISGKHQNVLAEVNIRYATENNIPVIRRISGGGTVYHDTGNLNFSFISNGKEGQLVDFKKFTKPVIDVLVKNGIGAMFEGKSDIRVNGLKISGNAEHVHRHRILHHGTLLVSSDLNNLSEALNTGYEKYTDKAIKSVRSKVTNIGKMFNLPDECIPEIKNQILTYTGINKNITGYSFSDIDRKKINELIEKKYKTWEWNFGYSPVYEFRNNLVVENKHTRIYLQVEKGIIINAAIKGFTELQAALKGVRHFYPNILGTLESNSNFQNENLKDLAWKFF